jgi:putative membrane protein
MKVFRSIFITAITIAILAWALPTISYMNLITLLLASLVLTILQKIAKPVLKLLFLPINIVTLGLFSFVINVFLLWLATYLVPGFRIQPMVISGIALGEFGSLLVVSVIISLTQNILHKLL